MHQKNCLPILIMLFAFLLFGSETLRACSCSQTPTVVDSFEAADDVIIAEITGVEKAADENSFYNGIKGAKMSVKKVFKGSLKEGDELFFEQGGGANCIWTYSEKAVGLKVLIYNTPYNGKRVVFGCGRSTNLAAAKDDLKYLENIGKVRGKTRISGTVDFSVSDKYHPGLSAQGKKIRIIGKNGTFTVMTDNDGFYETYDVPAGDYLIEPETPLGWKVDKYWLQYSPSVMLYYPADAKFPNRFFMRLEPNRHASVDFKYEIDNSIQGRLLYPDGQPMKNTCLYAISTDDPDLSHIGNPGCTNDRGVFKITEMYDKSYVLVINGDGKISGKTPIKTLFYPGVNERAKASVINMSAGKKILIRDFRVPKLEPTVILSGTLTYADGTPAKTEKVQFVSDVQDKSIEGEPYDYTDSNGRFEIKIFKGQKGKLRAEMIFGTRHLESCTDLKKAVIEKNPIASGIITAATPWLEITGDQDLINMNIAFPFEKCERN